MLGLEHPIIHTHLQKFLDLDTPDRSVFGVIEGIPGSGTLMVWKINTQAKDGQANHHIVRIGMTKDGDRAPWLEKLGDKILGMADSGSMHAALLERNCCPAQTKGPGTSPSRTTVLRNYQ